MLVVEDDPSVAELLTTALGARDHTVIVTRTARAARDAVRAGRVDLVLLDLGLPDGDGIDLCGWLRSSTDAPILVVTADGDEERKVAALDLGADDYVTKPFSVPELMARVRAAARRAAPTAGPPTSDDGEPEEDVRVVGAVRIEPAHRIVTVAGRPVRLTRKEYDLLEILAEHPGALVTHERITERVWGPGGGSAGSLRVHVTNIRRKLGTAAECEIRSEPEVGYRLVSTAN